MAGEFGRAVTNLGVGLMERSQRKKELEEQRRFQKEQRKQEEEAYMRKQAYLAKLQAEQKAQEKAEKLEREKQGDIKVGRDGELVRMYRDESGAPQYEILREAQQRPEQVRWSTPIPEVIDGKVYNVRYDQFNNKQVLGESIREQPQLTALDVRRINAQSKYDEAKARYDSLVALEKDPQLSYLSSMPDHRAKVDEARAAMVGAKSQLDAYGGGTPLMESEPQAEPKKPGSIFGTILGGIGDTLGRVKAAGGDVGGAAAVAAMEGAMSPQSAADAASLASGGPAIIRARDGKTGKPVEAKSNAGAVAARAAEIEAELRAAHPGASEAGIKALALKFAKQELSQE